MIVRRRCGRSETGGFTLLEVLIAIAILALSMTSLLSSQMASIRATRYARGVSVAAFLAESKLLEIEDEMTFEGWGTDDKTFDGDFSEDGSPDVRYACLVDFVEIPDFNTLQQAKEQIDTDGGGAGPAAFVAGQDDQTFSALGMVWPIVKGAIEMSIRKVSCTVTWTDGAIEHDFKVETFWTDPKALTQLPQTGETSEDDDTRDGGGPGQPGQGRDRGPGGTGGTRPGGGSGTPAAPTVPKGPGIR